MDERAPAPRITGHAAGDADVCSREPERARVEAIFSSVARKGEWFPAEEIEVRAWFGAARLDFTQALLEPGVTYLDVSAWFGSVEILVPADVEVELAASAFLGEVEQRDSGGRVRRFLRDQLRRAIGSGESEPPDEEREVSVLRVEGRAVCGSITVKMR
jgi:hypothetical protein